MKKLLVLLLTAVILLSIAGCTGDVTPEKVTNNTQGAAVSPSAAPVPTPAAPKAEVFKIGDTVKAGDVYFTVNGVREDKGSEFMEPKDGNIYYLVDVTVENKSSESVSVSSLMMFKLIDSEGYSQDVTFGAETKGQLDGEVTAGRKLRGELPFEISKEAKGLELEIDPSLWGDGKIVVQLDR